MARSSQSSIETKTLSKTRTTHNRERWLQLNSLNAPITTMKIKYLLYLLIVCWIIKIGLVIFKEQVVVYLMDNHNFDPIDLGLLAGIPSVLFDIAFIILLIKIALYKNKSDFLNS